MNTERLILAVLFCLPLFASSLCDDSLWQHVYHPARLHVLKPCITVTGTILSATKQRDGDFHVRLRVDPQYQHLLSRRNVTAQRNCLVVEPMCENIVTQTDAAPACAGFSQTIFTRKMIGKHVAVTGAYVEDLQHGGWREIHPVTRIVPKPALIGPTAPKSTQIPAQKRPK